MATSTLQQEKARYMIQSAELLILDFDGTLVDSNELKWTAFETCFDNYPGFISQIRTYSRTLNHVPRQEKIQYICEKILGEKCSPERVNTLLARYNSETTKQIIEAPEIPGAGRFLNAMNGTKPMILLSSTPHDILLQLVAGRSMTSFFEHIRGAPVNKAEWMRTYIAERNPKNIVSIGDSEEDAQAAEKVGIQFIPIGHSLSMALPDFVNLI